MPFRMPGRWCINPAAAQQGRGEITLPGRLGHRISGIVSGKKSPDLTNPLGGGWQKTIFFGSKSGCCFSPGLRMVSGPNPCPGLLSPDEKLLHQIKFKWK